MRPFFFCWLVSTVFGILVSLFSLLDFFAWRWFSFLHFFIQDTEAVLRFLGPYRFGIQWDSLVISLAPRFGSPLPGLLPALFPFFLCGGVLWAVPLEVAIFAVTFALERELFVIQLLLVVPVTDF